MGHSRRKIEMAEEKEIGKNLKEIL